jgi:RNA-binding protein YlmH
VPVGDPCDESREQYVASLIENETIDISGAIAAVSLNGSDYGSLTHRDWLGAILALGLERHVLGDIAVLDEHRAVVFVKPAIVPFIADTLHHAGSDTVRASAITLPDGFEIPRSFERMEASVASPRLDGVVRALTNLSRSDAASLVLAGDVELNYFPEEKTDAPVEDGDILSIRGYGKYIIDSANTVTRRGRNRLVARKYK